MTTSSSANALPRVGQGSLSDQTSRVLLEAILDRTFAGDRLPNEPDLAQQLGVSRTTIRAALQALERLGVISRAPGRGTRVRPQVTRDCMMLHRLIGFRGMLEAHHKVTVEQTFTVEPARNELAAALGVRQGIPVLVNRKTMFADGDPAVHLIQEVPASYVPPDVVSGLVDGSLEPPFSIFTFSEVWPEREIDSSIVQMRPRVVPKGKFPLALKPGTPYVELEEIHYSDINEPVALTREIFDDRIVNLRLVRTK